jgi:hypothetical protein
MISYSIWYGVDVHGLCAWFHMVWYMWKYRFGAWLMHLFWYMVDGIG